MTYSLEFDQRALKEWQKLGDTTAFFKVVVALTVQLCRSFLVLVLPIRIQQHRSHWLPVSRLA